MTRRLIAGVVLALAVLAACGEGNVLEQGQVVDREYDDPDTWTTYGSTCVARNRDGWCTFSIPTSSTHHDDAHWKLRVIGVDDEGKERREWHEVTETLYDIGQMGVVINFRTGQTVPR